MATVTRVTLLQTVVSTHSWAPTRVFFENDAYHALFKKMVAMFIVCSFSQISGMIMNSNISLPDYSHEYSTIPFLVLSTIGAGRVAWQAGKVCIFLSLLFCYSVVFVCFKCTFCNICVFSMCFMF